MSRIAVNTPRNRLTTSLGSPRETTTNFDEIVATIGTHAITRAELDQHVKAKRVRIDDDGFEVLREGLEDLVAKRLYELEANERGISVSDLEMEVRVGAEHHERFCSPGQPSSGLCNKDTLRAAKDMLRATDERITSSKNFLEAYNRAMESAPEPQRRELAKAGGNIAIGIARQLAESGVFERQETFLDQLKRKYDAMITLKPDTYEVSDGGRPALGGDDAPVTIIEFAHYDCPFSRREASIVDTVIKHYGSRVRFVHRDFPLFSLKARSAAEAAACAEEQGKFWEYRRALWSSGRTFDALSELANELGLASDQFDDCFTNRWHSAIVDRDITDGESVGVKTTPTFFINGRRLYGAKSFEVFKNVIDDELERNERQNEIVEGANRLR